jgi:hypothetical protein
MTRTAWIAILVVIVANLAFIVFGRAYERNKQLRRSVFTSLDEAKRNGHFNRGGSCHGMSAEHLAQYMALYAVDYDGGYYTIDILPYVRQWMEINKDAG